jgi:hypothetical protein
MPLLRGEVVKRLKMEMKEKFGMGVGEACKS